MFATRRALSPSSTRLPMAAAAASACCGACSWACTRCSLALACTCRAQAHLRLCLPRGMRAPEGGGSRCMRAWPQCNPFCISCPCRRAAVQALQDMRPDIRVRPPCTRMPPHVGALPGSGPAPSQGSRLRLAPAGRVWYRWHARLACPGQTGSALGPLHPTPAPPPALQVAIYCSPSSTPEALCEHVATRFNLQVMPTFQVGPGPGTGTAAVACASAADAAAANEAAHAAGWVGRRCGFMHDWQVSSPTACHPPTPARSACRCPTGSCCCPAATRALPWCAPPAHGHAGAGRWGQAAQPCCACWKGLLLHCRLSARLGCCSSSRLLATARSARLSPCHLAQIGQALGSVRCAWAGLRHFVPELFVDTTGWAFPYPLARLAGARVAAYVHYPTISTDMLQR